MITGMLADLIGPDSLIVIAVVVVVLLFGGTRLPKLARGLGSASHEFKKGMETRTRRRATSPPPRATTRRPVRFNPTEPLLGSSLGDGVGWFVASAGPFWWTPAC